MRTRHLIAGMALAGALAVAASGASIAGIAAWKVLLAVIGFAVFVMAGRGGGKET